MTEEKRCSGLLKAWFYKHRRDLPWRSDLSGYRVWVSEVMLQQTQVSVVIPYFERWMQKYPSIEALAKASEDDVIKAWEGLGYYSRARNLHKAAQDICNRFNGIMPKTKQELLKIKGIGTYTAGAIAAFAFGEKVTAVDGNVRRVLSRLYMIEDSIDARTGQKKVEEYAEKLLCCDEPAGVVEGLIELGALVCQKVPKCWLCPLQKECQALKHGKTDLIPLRKKNPKITQIHRLVWVLIQSGRVLIRREQKNGVMQGLWHFPFLEASTANLNSGFKLLGFRGIQVGDCAFFDESHSKFAMGESEDVQDSPELPKGKRLKPKVQVAKGDLLGYLQEQLGRTLPSPKLLDPIKHGFTRFQAHLYPHIWNLQGADIQEFEDYRWVSFSELEDLPFCGGHRELKEYLLSTKNT